jgi:hypothetical protein
MTRKMVRMAKKITRIGSWRAAYGCSGVRMVGGIEGIS